MALTDKSSQRTALFLVVILVVIIIILAFVFGGVQGIFGFLRALLMIFMVVLFFGFIFFLVYFIFFKKHKVDLVHENWKEYIKSATDNGADMMGELVLTGDKNHSSKRFMTIKGYLRIKSFDGNEWDMIIGKKNPMNPLEEYKVIMLKPEEHSDLISDVYVYGISLIMKYGYYFLNSDMLNFDAIDRHVAHDTFRTVLFTELGDLKSIVDRAVGIDPDEIKRRNDSKLLKIPTLQGQNNNQNQNQGNQ